LLRKGDNRVTKTISKEEQVLQQEHVGFNIEESERDHSMTS
jgi:hypothetical protein